MASKRRRIAVVTGSRAEFGLLRPVMHAIDAEPGLELITLVTGTHLAAGTWRDVRAAGFAIDARVKMQTNGAAGRPADVAAVGRGVAGFGRALEAPKPDVVVVLGDRIEPFAAASAASIGGFRVAHIHGGDRAEGVADEAMRHAISKLAHLHFAATADSRRRLIRMGEPAEAVWRVGSPAIDGLADVTPADDAPDVIVLQHPIGDDDATERERMTGTLAATREHQRLVMMPNADAGSDGIRAAITGARVDAVEHLRRDRWLRLLAGAGAIVGNSSAGLIEAAALRTMCVNVGPRQAGRLKPAHVIDCGYGEKSVAAALAEALKRQAPGRHPYGDGRAGPRIADLLATIDLAAIPLRKHNRY